MRTKTDIWKSAVGSLRRGVEIHGVESSLRSW